MNPPPDDDVARSSPGAEAPAGKFVRWIGWWLEPRWRALATWLVLAFVSGAGLVAGRNGIDTGVKMVGDAFRSYLGISLPVELLGYFNLFALISWFQPLALRVGLVRGVIWMIAYAVLGIVVLNILGRWPGAHSWIENILLAHLCGLPGLDCIGARTRPWLSLVAGSLSVRLLALIYPVPHETTWFHASMLLMTANLPYAAIMLYGTRLIRRREVTLEQVA
jgi:hypothetical protein